MSKSELAKSAFMAGIAYAVERGGDSGFATLAFEDWYREYMRKRGVFNERDERAEREDERNRVAFKRETVYQDQPAQPPGAFTPINNLGLTATQIERRERKPPGPVDMSQDYEGVYHRFDGDRRAELLGDKEPPPKREADYWDALADQEATDAWLAARDGGDE